MEKTEKMKKDEEFVELEDEELSSITVSKEKYFPSSSLPQRMSALPKDYEVKEMLIQSDDDE
ncbi:MAG: hypothetical protein MJ247_05600 [Alphaproteobacteria bacterium]|nr:hypothetical protein [Alphaproteobacteria bacterium]